MLTENTESCKLRQIPTILLHMHLRLKKSFKVESPDRKVFKIPSYSVVYIISAPLSIEAALIWFLKILKVRNDKLVWVVISV